MDIPADRGLFRRDAIRQGVTDNELRTEKRRGILESVSRGLYVPANTLGALSVRDRHLLDVRATLSRSSPDVVVSHQSAAVVHGYDMWNPNLAVVQLSSTRRRGGHTNAHRHLHAGGLTEQDIAVVDGLRVTTPARTLADLARTMPFEQAVCVGDSGLRRSLITNSDVLDALGRSSSRGRSAATSALGFMDARSESVGESRSRVYVRRCDFPTPELQVNVLDPSGLLIGRPDFLWEDEGVIGEFDGMVKYGKFLRPGEKPGDAVEREKLREDLLRSYGWVVARWTWNDLRTRRAAEHIARAMELASRLPAPTTLRR